MTTRRTAADVVIALAFLSGSVMASPVSAASSSIPLPPPELPPDPFLDCALVDAQDGSPQAVVINRANLPLPAGTKLVIRITDSLGAGDVRNVALAKRLKSGDSVVVIERVDDEYTACSATFA